jgi:hypothetical protein
MEAIICKPQPFSKVMKKSYHGGKNNAVGFPMAGKFLALEVRWVYNTF